MEPQVCGRKVVKRWRIKCNDPNESSLLLWFRCKTCVPDDYGTQALSLSDLHNVKMHVNYICGWKEEIPFHFEVHLWGPLPRLSHTLDTRVLRESVRDVNNEGRNASHGDTESRPWIIRLSWDATEHVTANRPHCAGNLRTKAHVCRRKPETCHELPGGEQLQLGHKGNFSSLHLIILTLNCKIQSFRFTYCRWALKLNKRYLKVTTM